MLNTEASCREFLRTENASTIARQIQQDQSLCRASNLPSLLALYLPPPGSKLADAIALELFPETPASERVIRRTQYAGTITVMKAYLHEMIPESKHKKLPIPVGDFKAKTPSKEDFHNALNVLDFCLKSGQIGAITLSSRIEEIIPILQRYTISPVPVDLSINEGIRDTPPISAIKFKKNCYICQFRLLVPHHQYPSLCQSCGDFNLASSAFSLPGNLQLHGRTAVVTGARLNLGYHSALRLLRCGAKVIVTTRYPRDAESRYNAESDFGDWGDRLRIVGADFRAASDVFHLVSVVKECLNGWDEKGVGKLDILINNAAQTLTDSLTKEDQAVKKEEALRLNCSSNDKQLLLDDSGYKARIRGGVTGSKALDEESRQRRFLEDDRPVAQRIEGGNEKESGQLSTTRTSPSTSSWMQTLQQIPYEDIISAHSVNTFVPLILIREFFPIMGRSHQVQPQTEPHPETQATATTSAAPSANANADGDTNLPRSEKSTAIPAAYIINVSSREGIFEDSPTARSKDGHHVHTNLTKAALNMLTETEAGPAWRQKRVAMNTVDPGYMSAAPEIERMWRGRESERERTEGAEADGEDGERDEGGDDSGRKRKSGSSRSDKRGRAVNVIGECPIGWEDGAGRVLWPVAVGETGKGPVWGRFLKHFGDVEIDIGIGR